MAAPNLATFRASDRLLGRARRYVADRPYLTGSIALHGAIALVLMNMAGLGETERVMSVAAAARETAGQIARTEARQLEQRVANMREILERLAEAAGESPAPLPGPEGASPEALAARAKALSAAIDAMQRRLRADALARMTGMPLEAARREVEARAAAEPPPAAASSPAEAIQQLERRAKEALEAQRAQLEAPRNGIKVARDEPVSTGQKTPADGIPRSLAVQLAAEFRNGPPQGRVGEPGFEGGRSVNPKKVAGVAGGRIARADEPGPRIPRVGEEPPVRVPGGNLDLTGPAGQGGGSPAQPAAIAQDTLRTGAGRVIGPGGAYATRVYLDSWYLLGPFAAERRNALQTVYPPEEHVDLDGTYTGLDGRTLTWQYASRGFYPFIPPDRAERAVYYATTELRVDEGRDVWLAIAADDDSMLWLDGRLVWASAPGDKPWYRPPYYLPDEQVASLALAEGHRRVHLSPGTHRLLLKLVNDRERTFFSVVLAP